MASDPKPVPRDERDTRRERDARWIEIFAEMVTELPRPSRPITAFLDRIDLRS